MDNAEEYCITVRDVTKLDGARDKKQVWRPHVWTWDLSEANALHWSTCDIVRTFWRPHSDSAPRELCLLMITALSDAPQQIMVHSSNQRPRAYTRGVGVKKNPWAWYFTKTLLPLQRRL